MKTERGNDGKTRGTSSPVSSKFTRELKQLDFDSNELQHTYRCVFKQNGKETSEVSLTYLTCYTTT